MGGAAKMVASKPAGTFTSFRRSDSEVFCSGWASAASVVENGANTTRIKSRHLVRENGVERTLSRTPSEIWVTFVRAGARDRGTVLVRSAARAERRALPIWLLLADVTLRVAAGRLRLPGKFKNNRMVGDLYVGNAPGIRLFFPATSLRRKSASPPFYLSSRLG